ncbi:hypothetical protein PC128_g5946 [Phytophthora cactorum]|nr:hypothetical protein PC120_g1008 [Phytophthora cactorum]KAG3100106.1 hypothetical protein PC121_g1801 [Phytophthora cactorum]KAG3198533.1 hypothetical protein PC128_g5946 [Phytophthora cactorum]KAG4061046.1 hypothetical protein PC123_g4048 [Phytophthora cactorum]
MDRNEFPHQNDSQYESVRKMTGNFGMDALQSLVAATPAEQVELVNAFNTYERGLIAHVQGSMQPPMAEVKPSHQKPLRLKADPYEGKEGETFTSMGSRSRARHGRSSNLDRATPCCFRPLQP